MACYCDTPDDSDQAEIERRCKVRMYFDVQDLLTDKQIDECNKQSIKKFPMNDVNEHLCNICKILTKKQMQKVSAYYYEIKWPHKTLYDWYLKHIEDDKKVNELPEEE